MAETGTPYDLLIIGGGINGAGIARDAAGRGLKVLLAEKDDLAAATSSSSSKLIHGGLRYLEHCEFRLVAEALAEREVLLSIAPHLVMPLRFVMPHVPGLRPRWMMRAGLFLYDHLGKRAFAGKSRVITLPGSHGVDLRVPPYDSGLKPAFTKGYIYSDCRVDDARLVLANVVSARDHGADILTRTQCAWAKRVESGWQAQLQDRTGMERTVFARTIVNAAGPWVKEVLNHRLRQPSRDNVRLVKGSHIVVPRVYEGGHAFLLQNDDRRVVFMIPYEAKYTLIGTTDIALTGEPSTPVASEAEIEYLCRAAGRYLAKPLVPADVVWSYAGIRPLYDDGTADPSAITRDYTLRLDADDGVAPVLSVFGGKITTYRKLAEHALDKLSHWFPGMKAAWTGFAALPGGDFEGDLNRLDACLVAEYPYLPEQLIRALVRRHGTLVCRVLRNVRKAADLGPHFGHQLYACEVDYMLDSEWASETEDILYRRSKTGLHIAPDQRAALEQYVARRLALR